MALTEHCGNQIQCFLPPKAEIFQSNCPRSIEAAMSASPLQAVRAATTCSRVKPIAVRFETALSLTAAPAVAEAPAGAGGGDALAMGGVAARSVDDVCETLLVRPT